MFCVIMRNMTQYMATNISGTTNNQLGSLLDNVFKQHEKDTVHEKNKSELISDKLVPYIKIYYYMYGI